MTTTGTTNTRAGAGLGSWALPLFVTRQNSFKAVIVTFVIAGIAYLTSNHIHLSPPQLLPMTWFDQWVPFMPNSVWIYASEYLFFLVIYLNSRDMENLNKWLYSFIAQQFIAVAIFWLWPTTYPRDLFPLPEDLNAPTYFLFDYLRQADTPANCCPSLHVSSVFLCSFIYLDEQRHKFPFFFIWAAAIALSTLTTKQHYLVDLLTGFMLAVISYWVFHKLVPYRTVSLATKK